MGFRLVPKSMTLNDLERRNGRVVCIISQNSVALGPYYANVVEDTTIHSTTEMGFRLVPKSVTLNDLERCNGHYFALFCGIR